MVPSHCAALAGLKTPYLPAAEVPAMAVQYISTGEMSSTPHSPTVPVFMGELLRYSTVMFTTPDSQDAKLLWEVQYTLISEVFMTPHSQTAEAMKMQVQ